MTVARIQSFSPSTTLYLRAAGQWTASNLDSSQKFAPSGLSGVRAYGSGAILGDLGYLLNAEFRYNLGRKFEGQLQTVAFVDSAHVVVNKKTWVSGPNSATLSGVGIGIHWASPSQWTVRTTIAVPFGPMPELPGIARSVRVWTEVGKGF